MKQWVPEIWTSPFLSEGENTGYFQIGIREPWKHGDTVLLVSGVSGPADACHQSAAILRDLADRFDRLAQCDDPMSAEAVKLVNGSAE